MSFPLSANVLEICLGILTTCSIQKAEKMKTNHGSFASALMPWAHSSGFLLASQITKCIGQ